MSLNIDKILAAREFRAEKIKKLKTSFKAVITVKTNFPGVEKQHRICYILINRFLHRISAELYGLKELCDGADGPYYLLGSNTHPTELKKHLIDLETSDLLGRFIDLDVFDGEKSLSRGFMRKCYLCDKDAFVCAREKNHTENDLVEYIENTVLSVLKEELRQTLNQSMMMELDLHPKFGLVTPYTNGSHNDMDYQLMQKAKDAILPFFIDMFQIGYSSQTYQDIFNLIRRIGLKAEKAMDIVTSNINAYKGLIFNLGILVTAYGNILYNNLGVNQLFVVAKKISASVLEDFNSKENTFGFLSFEMYHIKGARGEAASGFQSVQKSRSYLRDLSEESRLRTLMFLISQCEDTVLLKRCGSLQKYYEVKQRFKAYLFGGNQDIESLNQYCLDNNLSFGGSADLLILTIFSKMLQETA